MLALPIFFLGVKVTPMDREELKEYIIRNLYTENHFRIVLLDNKKLFSSLFSKKLRTIILESPVVLPTSSMVSKLASTHSQNKVNPYQSITIFLDILRCADEMNYNVSLLGQSKRINSAAYKKIRNSFKNIRITGSYPVYQNFKKDYQILVGTQKTSPQIMICDPDNGGKKQEFWIEDRKKYFSNSILIGVDNTFSVIAGKKRMPPLWFQKHNLGDFHYRITHPLNLVMWYRYLLLGNCLMVMRFKKIFSKNKINS